MAKISTYIIDSTPQLTDKVIGTDVTDNDITKNYLIQDIVDLVPPPPPPTLNSTRMIYGDGNNLYAETGTLFYVEGGAGSVQEDTVAMTGTLDAQVCSPFSPDSLVIGKRVGRFFNNNNLFNSVLIGQDLLDDQAATGCSDNVVIGKTIGDQIAANIEKNVLLGSFMLQQSTKTATKNVIIGYEAAKNPNVQINDNVIIGDSAMRDAGNTNANLISNVVIGKDAGIEMASVGNNFPSNNVCIGTRAGAGQSGNNNIHIGTGTGIANNLGFFNIGIGANALANQTGSDFNTAVGNDALQQLTTGVNNTAIGKAAGSTVQGLQNTTNLGHNSQAQGDNEIVLGDNNVTILRCNTQIISGLSDIRDKDNVEELDLGLDFIMELEPVSWDWDRRDGTMKGQKGSGFIAQEVDEVVQANEAEDILPIVNKRNPDAWEVGNAALIPVLVKAIQELKAELDACKAEK